ncbi:MAG: hypothetical protein RR625_04600 [Christensenellaceae bacterium]
MNICELENNLSGYLDTLRKKGCTDLTVNLYHRYLKIAFRFLKNLVNTTEIEKGNIIDYKNYLAAAFKESTASSYLSCLNRYLKYLKLYNLCVENFVVKDTDFEERQMLTMEEYKSVLKLAKKKNIKIYYILHTIAATGINVNSLQYITVDAVTNGYIHVSVGKKNMTIILNKNIRKELRAYCEEYGICSGIIFAGRGENAVIDTSYLSREFKKLGAKLSIPTQKLCLRQLRYLFEQTYLERGNNIFDLLEMTGRKTTIVTKKKALSQKSIAEKTQHFEKLGL